MALRLPPRPGARRSVALIVTLAILAILLTMLIGFVVSTKQDRGATQSYGDSLRADQIALGGLDAVVASVRAEIAAPGLSTNFTSNNFTVSYPLHATNAVVQDTVTNAVYPLVKVSGAGSYLANGNTYIAIPLSGAVSTAGSLNNRRVTLGRWNKPQLVPAAAASLFPAPQWVVVGRRGAFAPAGANPAALGCTPGLASPNEVVGRYAYAVYDLGGLLDVNVAGYPSGASGNRGLMPWADLSQLGAAPALAAFPGIRNAASAPAYAAAVTNGAANGFLTVAPGDTAFLSRQELIRYAASNGFAAALPSLTVFSRELNGPTWAPGQPVGSALVYTNAAAFTGNGTVSNFFLPSVRATTAFTRGNGLPAVVGEPAAKYRFPLDQIGVLQAGLDTAAIGKYFGLAKDTSAGAYKKWIYTNPTGVSGPTAATRILPLNAITTREPDFFELLKATILTGSLGKVGRGDDYAGNAGDPDAATDNQIVQIGLNIIDQAGNDNLPTTVVFKSNEFYGIKDLPYISQVFITCISSHPLTSPAAASASIFFNLWNPHQTTAVSMPRLRLIPLGDAGTTAGAYTLQYVIPPSDAWTAAASGTLSAAGGANSIVFSPAISSYRTPALLTGGTVSGTATTLPGNSANGFSLAAPAAPATSSPGGVAWATADTGDQWRLYMKASNLSFALQYEYPAGSGAYHSYGVFAGQVSGANTSVIPLNAGLRFGYGPTLPLVLNSTLSTALSSAAPYGNSYYFTKSDPRTSRWTAFWNTAAYDSTTNGHALGGTNFKPFRLLPFGSADITTATSGYDISQWCVNTTGISYADADGVKRPGDNFLGGAGNTPFTVPASTPASGDGRPLVLERPFASVGELGYAFRDLPWKSLDFSSSLSADAGLLDVFTVGDGAARRTVSGRFWETAGRIGPNGPASAPLAALLAGAQKNLVPTPLSSGDAAALAGALTQFTAAPNSPLPNRAALADRFLGVQPATVLGPVKTEREVVVRALAESTNTRTWNLLVDVIAQTGHYPATAATFDDFVVTGERRYWLHVAVDRYTGEIVDQQLEAVSD